MKTSSIRAAERAAIARRAAAESIVLLKNEHATLPLPAGASLRVVGPDGWRYCGEGSAVVSCDRVATVAEGLAEAGFRVADNATDAAVLVVSRYSREGQDAKPEDAFLSEAEKAELARFQAEGIGRVAVVLNLGCGFDAAPLAADPAVGAVLHAWFPGQEGGRAVADVLSGAVNPGGRLAATLGNPHDWPSDASLMSSSHVVPYVEDVFVGYRWFETVPGESAKAAYPFGHGLSYTAFDAQVEGLDIPDVSDSPGDRRVSLRIRVTNTGAVAGRYSALLYSGVTGGEADHPARELRAYAKTRLLGPGESETLALSFAAADLAYFADEGSFAGSWVIDSGDYALYLGGSAREAAQIAAFRVEEPRIVSSPGLKLNPAALPKRFHADGGADTAPVAADGPAYKPEDCEAPPAANALRYPQPTFAGPRPHTLFDVARGELALDDFVAQLPREEQARLCFGNPILHPSYNKCIGGTAPRLGLTGVVPANACQGVQKRIGPATCFPCSALVACSFDDALAEEVAAGIGSECAEADVDILLGPGLDIHRHPSCGRNFEYFSEDPLVSGRMAAAYVRGLRRNGTLACLKHFACNDREYFRDHYSSVVSERALREIHLRGFEIAVKESAPASIMTAYNRVNGRRSGVFHGLLQGVLRDEWGWDGVVVSDCGAKSLPWEEVAAGADVHLNGAPPDPDTMDLFRHVFQYKVVPPRYFRATVRRVLGLVMKSRRFKEWMARWG